MLNGGQLYLQYKLENIVSHFIYGNFSYVGLKDNSPIVTGNGGSLSSVKANGNSLDPLNNYPNNFDLEERALEIQAIYTAFKVGLFYESIKNVDVEIYRDATTYGINGEVGLFNFSYSFLNVEKDSVVAAFTDSDFNGGKVSSKGTIVGIGYKLSNHSQILYTQFQSQGPMDSESGNPQDYKRSHLDFSFTF